MKKTKTKDGIELNLELEDIIDSMHNIKIKHELFDKKMAFLDFLRGMAFMEEGIFNEEERRKIKSKLFEIIDSIDFEPALYKKKLLTEKTK